VLLQIQHGIGRSAPCHFSRDIHDPLLVLVINGFFLNIFLKGPELTQLHVMPGPALDHDGFQACHIRARRPGQPQDDGQFVLFSVLVDDAGLHAGQGNPQGLDDVIRGDAVAARLFPVNSEKQLTLTGLHGVVDVHNPFDAGHGLFDRVGRLNQIVVGMPGRAVHLGHHGGEYRRTRRRLDQLDAGARGLGNGFDVVSHAQYNGMARHLTVVTRQEVDADVSHISPLAHVVVAHQAVEVHGRGCAHSGNIVRDLGHGN